MYQSRSRGLWEKGATSGAGQEVVKIAEKIPVVLAPNMSVGVNVTLKLLEMAAKALSTGYDIEIIAEINEQGTTVLLVEQNALMALNAAHRGYVIQTGKILLADTAANLAANEQVRQAYLGEI
mgnify:CR=1 FL=1